LHGNIEHVLFHQTIPVKAERQKDSEEHKYVRRIGLDYTMDFQNYTTGHLYAELIENYSQCYAVDPVFGRPFDNKDNGLVTKLCAYLTEIQSNNQ